MRQEQDAGEVVHLCCCQGAPAPAQVVDGWRRFLGFPAAAARPFWALLEPSLTRPGEPLPKTLLDHYCAEFQLPHQDVVAALFASGFVLERSAAANLAPAAVHEDFVTLSGDDTARADLIAGLYGENQGLIRRTLFEETLADHGKIATGVDWRVDRVVSSDRGADLEAPVVFLTIRYREGRKEDRFSVQLTPEALTQFRNFMNRFESVPGS